MARPIDLMTETAHDIAYQVMRGLLRPILESRLSIRAEGVDRVPPSGPALLVCNHRSVLDPLVIGAVVHRHVHFVAARWMGRVPGLAEVLRSLGILILPPPARTRELIEASREHLLAGALLCIFPEGAWPTVGPPPIGQVAPFHHGAARIILDCGIPELPVVPIALVPGPERVLFRLPGEALRRLDHADPLGWRATMDLMAYDAVRVRFGKPLAFVLPAAHPLESGSRERAIDFITRRLRQEVASLARG